MDLTFREQERDKTLHKTKTTKFKVGDLIKVKPNKITTMYGMPQNQAWAEKVVGVVTYINLSEQEMKVYWNKPTPRFVFEAEEEYVNDQHMTISFVYEFCLEKLNP